MSPDTCAAGDATQSTDFLSLVMCFCVQLLHNRGATSLSSLNTLKTKQNMDAIRSGACEDSHGMWSHVLPVHVFLLRKRRMFLRTLVHTISCNFS